MLEHDSQQGFANTVWYFFKNSLTLSAHQNLSSLIAVVSFIGVGLGDCLFPLSIAAAQPSISANDGTGTIILIYI
jgi:hypothetical protein